MKLWKTSSTQKREDIVYHNTRSEFETEQSVRHFGCLICQEMKAKGKDGVVFLYISTDWPTGNSLGPLASHKLRGRHPKETVVIGILDKPVYVVNLDLYTRYIRLHYPDYVIVATGTSVGNSDHVGYAILGRGALQPDLDVSEELKAVGDIAITGIVGGAGDRGPATLQGVCLFTITKMASCICEGICLVERLWENAAII